MKQHYNTTVSNSLISKIKILLLFVLLGFNSNLFSQSIPATNGGLRCFSCAPTGWNVITGTPDISNRDRAANTGIGGGNATWVNAPLPLPPNGHETWISIRDLGALGAEESVGTTLTGLTVGRNYELVVYTMSVLSNQDGGGTGAGASGPAWKYAGTFIDQLRYRLNGGAILSQTNISQNTWAGTKLPFTATAATSSFQLLPGNNATVTNSPAGSNGIETVQVAITLNAVNTVPVANNDNANTTFNTPVTFNVVTNDIDFDTPGGTNPVYSGVNAATVDLNPALAGIQNTFTSTNGVWTVNNLGQVTFTPNAGFTGTESITYNVRDGFTIDGLDGSAVSNNATMSVTVPPQTNLGVSKTANTSVPTIGGPISFTITANNAGPNNATGVVVNDLLPNGYTFTNATVPAGTTYNATTGVWTIGNLNNGASLVLTINATVNGTGNYANTATITGNEADATTANNTATFTPVPFNSTNQRTCNSTAITAPSLNFQNPTFVSGSNNATIDAGDVYRFSNVVTGVDALVTVLPYTNGATIAAASFDAPAVQDNVNGFNRAFQPTVSGGTASGAAANFRFDFVTAGGNASNVVNLNFYVTPVDIDGTDTVQEFVQLTLPDAYIVNSPTSVAVTIPGGTIRGTSGNRN